MYEWVESLKDERNRRERKKAKRRRKGKMWRKGKNRKVRGPQKKEKERIDVWMKEKGE